MAGSRRLNRRVWLIAALVLAGCGRAPDLSGTWVGRWASDDGVSRGTFRVQVSQSGNRISGRIALEGTWFSRARIVGVVEGSHIRWGVLHGGVSVLTFEGRVEEGRSAGTYRGPGGSTGRWTAVRIARP
ncbi:MAG: hypothetical protein C4304_09495 [candidate division GAL15 bacterium]